MSRRILICSPNVNWANKLTEFLVPYKYETVGVTTGKDAQLSVYHEEFATIVIDSETQENSAFEVLRYVRLNKFQLSVVLVFQDRKNFEQTELSEDEFKKLGATDVVIPPFSLPRSSSRQYGSWCSIPYEYT